MNSETEKERAIERQIEQVRKSFEEQARQLAADVKQIAGEQHVEQAKRERRQLMKRGDDVDDVIEACDELGHTVRSSGNKIADALADMGASVREAGKQIDVACQESSVTMRKFSNLLGDTLVEAAERAAESSEEEGGA